MKKIIFKLLFVFAFVLCINITSVYAESCESRSQNNCEGFTSDFHYCKYRPVSGGGCQSVSCSEVPYQQCGSAVDKDGEKCVQYDYQCLKKSVADTYEEQKRNGDDKKTIPGNDDPDGYDNYESDGDVTCGNNWTFNRSIANVTYYMVLVFQILAPVALIILGMIDLFKGITSGKEDDMKKGQATFIKRLVVAFLLFSVITIVRMVLNILSTDTIIDCFDCFVNGAKSCDKGL